LGASFLKGKRTLMAAKHPLVGHGLAPPLLQLLAGVWDHGKVTLPLMVRAEPADVLQRSHQNTAAEPPPAYVRVVVDLVVVIGLFRD
jgi:hypothetical protein